jgi:hypothetical protein
MPGSAYLPGRSTAAEDHLAVVLASAQELERGDAVLVATHRLAIDQAGADLEHGDGAGDQRESCGPVVAVSGEQADGRTVAARLHPIAVELDFVQPAVARGSARAEGRQGAMKPGGMGERSDMASP